MKKTSPKIMLINPPQNAKYPQPPLGLAMIAAVLEESEYEVKILDLQTPGASEEMVSEMVSQEKPDVVGITAFTPTINAAIRVAKKVKECDDNNSVILGGPHGTILPEETLRSAPEIDIVVRGEGEQTILELVKVLEKNSQNGLKGISGISYREGPNVRSNPPRPPILDMDMLPFPAFHLLPIGKYRLHPPFGRRSPVMPVVTSRGCPYRCIFCSKSVFGKKYRSNSPDYVIDEIRLLNEKFGVKEIKFYDDVFTLDRKRVLSVCRQLKEVKLDIPWTCETRVNLVDEELLKIMKDSGCYMIAYGVESGSQGILNNLRKDITLEQAVDAFGLTRKAGVEAVAYFMIGSPEETPDTLKDTLEFAKKLDPDFVQFSITTPYPGTELYERVARKRCLSEEWDKYVYADLKSADYPAFETKTLRREDMKEWNKKAYASFYLRWSYLWKRMKKMTSWGELKTNITGLHMLMELIK